MAIIWQSTLDHHHWSLDHCCPLAINTWSDSQHLITTYHCWHHLTVNTWSLLAIIWQSTLSLLAIINSQQQSTLITTGHHWSLLAIITVNTWSLLNHHLTVNTWSLLAIINSQHLMAITWQSTLDHYWPSPDSQHFDHYSWTVNTWYCWPLLTVNHCWPSSDSQHLITWSVNTDHWPSPE